MRRCALVHAGTVSYKQGLDLQQRAAAMVACGQRDGLLLLMEHLPVITMGRGHSPEELLYSPQHYAVQGIELVPSDRGGKSTCHNPGQLVGYPVLNLARWQKDAHWYTNRLEEMVIQALALLGFSGERRQGYSGVWFGDKKVCALGLAVRRWITSHGFALNVSNDLSIFAAIIPCGIHQFGVTSLAQAAEYPPSMDAARRAVADAFVSVFDCSLQVLTPSSLVQQSHHVMES